MQRFCNHQRKKKQKEMEYLEIISTATSSLIRLKNILGVRRLAQRVYGQTRTVVEETRLRRHTSVRTSRSQ